MNLTTSYIPADTSEPILETTIGSSLGEAAKKYPDQPGLVSGEPASTDPHCWTFAEMLVQVELVAKALLNRFEPGERIAVWAPNIPEWVLLYMGTGMAGLILVPLNPAFRKTELEYALKQSRAAGIFYIPTYRENPLEQWVFKTMEKIPTLREAISFSDWETFLRSASLDQSLPEISPGDIAQIQYTSGTTGMPKGALLTHRSVTNNGRFVGMGLGLRPGDAYMNPLPFFHVAGCVVGILGSLTNCATLVHPTAFEPGLVLDMCEREKVNVMGGVPTVLIAMMEHGGFAERDLSSLKTIGGGGAPVPTTLVRHIEDTMEVEFSVLFGQSEASCSITKTRPLDSPENKAETVGLPLPQTEVQIIDTDTGQVVNPGITGELCTRGYAIMQGYHDMPDATVEAIDEQGWLHTGDLATMDTQGYCRIVGRIKDMIIRGGENIYPREIEDVLFAHPGVGDVAVIGVPDEKWGEAIAAFIRPGAGQKVEKEELHTYVRKHLAPNKTPKEWIFVDELPVTASGKIQKFVLLEQFMQTRAQES
ncbi:MAG: AMP-dependent synthetase [Gammaproteobacteria bacterium]|jgi:fatty-acyl-CoA synthase|nr:AMP-dependent synthetase [Gammaproteobacteria bacterium]|tara:strand:+ start:31336 stop:32940 length:1605 start_codon:yes stop_codon:yes gene_type:complete